MVCRRWGERSAPAAALERSADDLSYLGPYDQRHWGGVSDPWRMLHDDFDGVDTDVFQYLYFLAEEIPPLDSTRRLLIVDNASWHKAQRLNWHHFEVHYLPGYSPDLAPIERLWLRLKVDFFSDFIAKSPSNLPSVFVTL